MTHRALRRFHQQSTQKRISLLADVSQPLPTTAAGMLRGNQPEITGHLLPPPKSSRRSQRQHERQRLPAPLPDGSSTAAPPAAGRLLDNRDIQFAIERPVDPAASANPFFYDWPTAAAANFPTLPPGRTPQLPLPLHALVQRQRLQLVLHLAAYSHQLRRCQQQLPRIPFFRLGTQISENALPPANSPSASHLAGRSSVSAHNWRESSRHLRSTTSCPNSASICSNHCDVPRLRSPRAPAFAALHKTPVPPPCWRAQLRSRTSRRRFVQHGNLLIARMKITSYNLHFGSFLPSLGRLARQVYSA